MNNNLIKTVDGIPFLRKVSGHPLLDQLQRIELACLTPNAPIKQNGLKKYSYHNAYWGYWDEHCDDKEILAKFAKKKFNGKSHVLMYEQLITDDDFVRNHPIDFVKKYAFVPQTIAFWFSLLNEGQSMKEMLIARFKDYDLHKICVRCNKRARHYNNPLCRQCYSWNKSGLLTNKSMNLPVKPLSDWYKVVDYDLETCYG